VTKLNLGSGEHNKDGYVNLDHRFEPAGQVKGDAFSLTEFEDNSVDEIRAYALLEHASQIRTLSILELWYRKLKPGGLLNISVPDLLAVLERCKKYLDAPEWSYENWMYLNERVYGGPREYKQYGDERLVEFPGYCKFEVGLHKAMFDEKTIVNLMKMVGFKDVKRLPNGSTEPSRRPVLHKEISMVGVK